MNFGIPYVQDGLRKGRGTKHQTANIHWIIEKARKLMKNTYLCFIKFSKVFDCVDYKTTTTTTTTTTTKTSGKLTETGIPDHLICLLRNLYAGQEATTKTEHGTADWFQIRKGVCQGCISSP